MYVQPLGHGGDGEHRVPHSLEFRRPRVPRHLGVDGLEGGGHPRHEFFRPLLVGSKINQRVGHFHDVFPVLVAVAQLLQAVPELALGFVHGPRKRRADRQVPNQGRDQQLDFGVLHGRELGQQPLHEHVRRKQGHVLLRAQRQVDQAPARRHLKLVVGAQQQAHHRRQTAAAQDHHPPVLLCGQVGEHQAREFGEDAGRPHHLEQVRESVAVLVEHQRVGHVVADGQVYHHPESLQLHRVVHVPKPRVDHAQTPQAVLVDVGDVVARSIVQIVEYYVLVASGVAAVAALVALLATSRVQQLVSRVVAVVVAVVFVGELVFGELVESEPETLQLSGEVHGGPPFRPRTVHAVCRRRSTASSDRVVVTVAANGGMPPTLKSTSAVAAEKGRKALAPATPMAAPTHTAASTTADTAASTAASSIVVLVVVEIFVKSSPEVIVLALVVVQIRHQILHSGQTHTAHGVSHGVVHN
mmetsp:Transcript_62539/g.125275  ORF Transcript_62539/g.125275 Transcript_62539/m.125275 type:complete len:470 (+) Transcript_62539:755-2164(+)